MFVWVSAVVGELDDELGVGEDDAVFEEEVARGPVDAEGGVVGGGGVAEAWRRRGGGGGGGDGPCLFLG